MVNKQMRIILANNRYEIYADGTCVATTTMPKFMQTMLYHNRPSGNEPALHRLIIGAFDLLNDDLDWQALLANMRTPSTNTDEEPEEEIEELPDAPSWDNILTSFPSFRRTDLEMIMCFTASRKDVENPPWLSLVSPPSTGKSFLLEMFDHPTVSLIVDDFTDNALASGRPNVDAAEVNSMLDDSDGRNLIIHDMSAVFGQRADKVNKFISSLTNAYGGRYRKYSPGSGNRMHHSRTTIIVGMTNQTYKGHRKYMTKLGNRFLFYSLKRPTYMKLKPSTRDFDRDEMRLDICALQQEILAMPQPSIPQPVDDYLFDMVHKTVILRNLKYATKWDEIEGDGRLYQEMSELAMTRAKIYNRSEVTMEDIEFLKPLLWETIDNEGYSADLLEGWEYASKNKGMGFYFTHAKKFKLLTPFEVIAYTTSLDTAKVVVVTKLWGWNDDYHDFVSDMLEYKGFFD